MVTKLLNGDNTTESFGFNESCIGEICAAKCRAENGQIILMVTIYISPNHTVEKNIEFIHKNLVAYTEAISTLLNKLPIILSGDFNVDFSKDKSKPLIDFLKSKFNLIMPNDPNESAAKYKRNVYKFTINYDQIICKISRDFGEIETQRELENVIFHILNLNQMKYGESTICTSLFRIKINIYPWQICDKVCFKAANDTFYFASKHQILLTFMEKTQRQRRPMHDKYVEAQTFTRWYGEEFMRGGCHLRRGNVTATLSISQNRKNPLERRHIRFLNTGGRLPRICPGGYGLNILGPKNKFAK
ncbi:uncharacterized protein TNCV_1632311 [Trichonephila clavipes]|nr:uncharacterized protein TNCV_1632311 [Trichonephila clavipes]